MLFGNIVDMMILELLDQELRLRRVFHHVNVFELIKVKDWFTLRVIFNFIKRTGKVI